MNEISEAAAEPAREGSATRRSTTDGSGTTVPGGWRSQIRLRDLFATSLLGPRSRPGRTALTAIGVAIGIAAMIAVTGISSSSNAALLAQLDAYGTNVLEVRAAANGLTPEPLPAEAPVMLDRIPSVTGSASVIRTGAAVRRNHFDGDLIGIDAIATNGDLGETLLAEVAIGRMIDDYNRSLPVVVLGSAAAERLGIVNLRGGPTVRVGDRSFAVIGILNPFPLNPDLDRTALIGDVAAVELLAVKPNPSSVFLRIAPDRINETKPLLARTANPDSPSKVSVSRPSDLLEARAEIDKTLRNLLLTLGAIALAVGGLGIANVMVISVLERQGEIGLRRAMGAKRSHVRAQFVLEAGTLSALGGMSGVVIGTAITWAYALSQGWLLDIPLPALIGGIGAAVTIGMFAGLYPANKAARLDPADAVRAGTR